MRGAATAADRGSPQQLAARFARLFYVDPADSPIIILGMQAGVSGRGSGQSARTGIPACRIIALVSAIVYWPK